VSRKSDNQEQRTRAAKQKGRAWPATMEEWWFAVWDWGKIHRWGKLSKKKLEQKNRNGRERTSSNQHSAVGEIDRISYEKSVRKGFGKGDFTFGQGYDFHGRGAEQLPLVGNSRIWLSGETLGPGGRERTKQELVERVVVGKWGDCFAMPGRIRAGRDNKRKAMKSTKWFWARKITYQK